MRRTVTVGVLSVSLVGAACTDDPQVARPAPTPTAVATAAAASALAWNDRAAASFNGELVDAVPLTACGASDRRFLGELLGGNPLDFKVPKRLGEIHPIPSQVAVSGTVVSAVLGNGDFPFDHTMGADYNADVELDEPFRRAAQADGRPAETLHIELAEGQLPHTDRPAGAPERSWPDMVAAARDGIQAPFVPATGDRVLVMGTWIVDCGHTNFGTELHPITMVAVARAEGDATVVHLFYNPWRETQLYNPDASRAVDFERPGRLDDPTHVPFPRGLIDSVLAIATGTPEPGARLSSWAVLAPNVTSPPPFRVCAPSASGTPRIGAALTVRPGVRVSIEPDSPGCATVTVDLASMAPAKPVGGVCVTPWDFLSDVASAEAGESGDGDTAVTVEGGDGEPKLDLKAELARFLPSGVASRLDPDPVMNCYDAVEGPDAGGLRPVTTEVTDEADAAMPVFGTVVVASSGTG